MFVTDSTPPSCLGVADTIEVALLSDHRDLGYGVEKFDDLLDIYYGSQVNCLIQTDWRPLFTFH